MRKYIKIILYLILIFYVTSLFFREINGDECIIAEHSYRLVQDGYVKSLMFTGLGLEWEIRQFHYHKLFVILGALIIDIFDVSLYALRSISLISAFLFFILLYFYLKYKKATNHSSIFFVMMILLLLQSHFFSYSFLFRPEILLMLLIFISFLLIEFAKKEQNSILIILSGITAGLAVTTHLNGLIAIFAGLLLLLIQKEFYFATLFFISSIIVSLLYFYDISSLSELQKFIYQFKSDPNFSSSHFFWYSPVLRLIEEHKRFFHSPKEISLTLLLVFSLCINLKSLWNENKNLVIYLFSMIFFLAITTHGKTDKYLILYLPFMLYIISFTIIEHSFKKKSHKIIYFALLFLFVITNLITDINSLIFYNPIKKNEEIAKNMEQNSNVMIRETFFFNEIKHFNIHIPMAYELKASKMKSELNRDDFFHFAKNNNDRYIVIENISINKHLLKLISWDSLYENQDLNGYKVKKKTDEYVIFETD